MEAVIRKWGNSPALRLPAAVMKSAGFNLEQHVIITASKGRIVIEPVTQPEYKPGVVLSDQVKSLDWRVRQPKKKGAVPEDVLQDVRAKIKALLQIG